MDESLCKGNCNTCKNYFCIYDEPGDIERKPLKRNRKPFNGTLSERQKAAYNDRKQRPTLTQIKSVWIYEEGQRTGIKNTVEYNRALNMVRYLRKREQILEDKKRRQREKKCTTGSITEHESV